MLRRTFSCASSISACQIEALLHALLYAKHHAKGFEILGISFDKEKDTLKEFIAVEKIAWPQFFDGQGWENKIEQKYEVTSLPTLWLVDRKGILRDLNGDKSLAAKIEKLLAEK